MKGEIGVISAFAAAALIIAGLVVVTFPDADLRVEPIRVVERTWSAGATTSTRTVDVVDEDGATTVHTRLRREVEIREQGGVWKCAFTKHEIDGGKNPSRSWTSAAICRGPASLIPARTSTPVHPMKGAR